MSWLGVVWREYAVASAPRRDGTDSPADGSRNLDWSFFTGKMVCINLRDVPTVSPMRTRRFEAFSSSLASMCPSTACRGTSVVEPWAASSLISRCSEMRSIEGWTSCG